MSARRKFSAITRRAEREAFSVVEAEVRKTLPVGWKLHIAVGWGLTLFNADGDCVFGDSTPAPPRMPKGARNACRLAADYADIFGYANQVIRGEVA
jgi:hypothetical protein